MHSEFDATRAFHPEIAGISTSWRLVNDPLAFFLTYGPAVRNYLTAILQDADGADEVLQDLLVQITEQGFRSIDPARGGFRPYLKAVVRNAALKHLKAIDRRATAPVDDLADDSTPEKKWRDEWRQCILDKAWRALDRHQRASKSNFAYTVLRLTVDHPELPSPQLAELAAERIAQPLSAEAFRKQLSRARRIFAELIVAEVRQTLDQPTPDEVRGELGDLGMLEYLGPYLADR